MSKYDLIEAVWLGICCTILVGFVVYCLTTI
jgi:hypothetical protein